jgi:hypothetical protein
MVVGPALDSAIAALSLRLRRLPPLSAVLSSLFSPFLPSVFVPLLFFPVILAVVQTTTAPQIGLRGCFGLAFVLLL